MSEQPPQREYEILEIRPELRQQIVESDYGRRAGWILVLNGQPVATFTEPEFVEMFWVSYKLTMLVPDEKIEFKLLNREYWYEEAMKEIEFRNQRFSGLPRAYDFPLVTPPYYSNGRFAVRGLYFVIDPPPKPKVDEPCSILRKVIDWFLR